MSPYLPLEQYRTTDIYIESLIICSIRCFITNQKIVFSNEKSSVKKWSMIIGNNGTGKSTILQCISESSPILNSNFLAPTLHLTSKISRDPYGYLDPFKHTLDESRVILTLIKDNTTISTGFYLDYHLIDIRDNEYEEGWESLQSREDLDFAEMFVVGYGGLRRIGTHDNSDLGDSCTTLFDPEAQLINADLWLSKADYAARINNDERTKRRLRVVEEALIAILPDVSKFRYRVTDDYALEPIAEAQTPYGWVRIRELSLGYQTALAWVVDFAARMIARYPHSENPLAEPAVCLVDEIDLHLHPQWQRELIQKLDEIFPRTQFIATAHSPLVVQAAPDANIILLKREGDHVVVKNDVDEIRKWRVDQILASELFEEQPIYAPEIQALLDEREILLSQAELSDNDKARVAVIDTELDKLPSAARPADQEAIDLIRRTAALLKETK